MPCSKFEDPCNQRPLISKKMCQSLKMWNHCVFATLRILGCPLCTSIMQLFSYSAAPVFLTWMDSCSLRVIVLLLQNRITTAPTNHPIIHTCVKKCFFIFIVRAKFNFKEHHIFGSLFFFYGTPFHPGVALSSSLHDNSMILSTFFVLTVIWSYHLNRLKYLYSVNPTFA